MSSNASPEGADLDEGRCESSDPARRFIHMALALYLAPVVGVVCAIGLVSILFVKITRATGRLGIGWVGRSDSVTGALAKSAAMRPLPARGRKKIQV